MNSMTVTAEEDNLDEVIDFIMDKLSDYELDEDIQMQLELAIEEIFMNIVSYAYNPNVGDAEVHVEVKENPLSVEIGFLDSGVPFNPLEQDADTSKEALEEHEGGLGIHMVKKLMDSVAYTYEDGKNILWIKKRME